MPRSKALYWSLASDFGSGGAGLAGDGVVATTGFAGRPFFPLPAFPFLAATGFVEATGLVPVFFPGFFVF